MNKFLFTIIFVLAAANFSYAEKVSIHLFTGEIFKAEVVGIDNDSITIFYDDQQRVIYEDEVKQINYTTFQKYLSKQAHPDPKIRQALLEKHKALGHSIWNGDVQRTQEMLADGANPNGRYHGATALMLVYQDASSRPVSAGDILAITQLLIDYGTDINAQDTFTKDTALILAIKNKFIDSARLLIENGADVHIQNQYGKDAFDYVKYIHDDEFLEYLYAQE